MQSIETKAMDFRAQLQANERKTKMVIACFIGLFVLVGLVVDTFVAAGMYHAPAGRVFQALIMFQITPYATLIMLAIALTSILVTYRLYDRIMLLGTDSHEVTTENARDITEKQLYNVVEEMKVAAGLKYMPKVFLIEADYMNAFASGYSERSAMVAITRGLIEKLNRAELQAVMAHELSHIRHHDIKLTLTVAVLSNIMLIAIDVLFYSALFGGNNRRRDNRLLLVILVLRYVLPLVTALLTLFLSRTREYMADAGCVELMRDNAPLANALMKISQDYQVNAEAYSQTHGQTAHESVRRASYIFDPAAFVHMSGLSDAFSTHPDMKKRLAALGFKKTS